MYKYIYIHIIYIYVHVYIYISVCVYVYVNIIYIWVCVCAYVNTLFIASATRPNLRRRLLPCPGKAMGRAWYHDGKFPLCCECGPVTSRLHAWFADSELQWQGKSAPSVPRALGPQGSPWPRSSGPQKGLATVCEDYRHTRSNRFKIK